VQPSWAHLQPRRAYPDFVGQFDALRDDEVRWEPYTDHDLARRAPSGLSSLCVRDAAYWKTRKPLVFDVFVEEHAVHRVLRQFGLYQVSGLLPHSVVPPQMHQYVYVICPRVLILCL
jgi:hypothetical protein